MFLSTALVACLVVLGGALGESSRDLQTEVKSECVNGILFIVKNSSEDRTDFDGAVSACESIPETTTETNFALASLQTVDQFNLLIGIIGNEISTPFWLGLRDVQEDNDNQIPSRFSYVSEAIQELSEITSLGNSEFPWGNTQPDDLDSVQDCVVIATNELDSFAPRLDDDACTRTDRFFICSADCSVLSDDSDGLDSKSSILLSSLGSVFLAVILISLMLLKQNRSLKQMKTKLRALKDEKVDFPEDIF